MIKKIIISLCIMLTSISSYAQSHGYIDGIWNYSSYVDEMKDVTLYQASKFSYEAEPIILNNMTSYSKLLLTIGYNSATPQTYVSFMLSRGKNICQNETTVNVRFDKKPIEQYHVKCDNPTAPDYDLTIKDESERLRFIIQMKTASRVIVEVPVKNNGPVQFKFDPSGLTWLNDN